MCLGLKGVSTESFEFALRLTVLLDYPLHIRAVVLFELPFEVFQSLGNVADVLGPIEGLGKHRSVARFGQLLGQVANAEVLGPVDDTCVGVLDPHDRLEKRRLPDTIAANEGYPSPIGQLQCHIAEQPSSAMSFFETGDRKHSSRIGPLRPSTVSNVTNMLPTEQPTAELTTGTAGEEAQARQLRRMKMVATAMLVVAAIIFIVARGFEEDYGFAGYVRATAEAAMVGALADWFAVTALFKHPLGLPIPHTAIIPKRKNDIGEGLGDFVQSNFLTGEVVAEKLSSVQLSHRLGRWMSDPQNAKSIVAEVGVVVSAVSDVLADDDDVKVMVDGLVRDRLSKVPVAPVLGRVIDAGMDGDHHHELYNAVLKGAANFLHDNETTFRRRLMGESPWWVPEPIDDRIFDKIYGAVMTFLREVDSNPDHQIKRDMDIRSREFAERLRSDERLIAQGEQLKQELIDHPEFQLWTQDLWSSLQRGFGDATKDADSDTRRRIEDALVALANRLIEDKALQEKVDRWIESIVVYLAEAGRAENGSLIANTVEGWDAKDTADRIELQVGRDLQFIRINGTLVGGLAGLIIFTLSEAFF